MGNAQPKKSMSVEPKERHAIKLLFLGEKESGISTVVNSILRREYKKGTREYKKGTSTKATVLTTVPELLGVDGEPLCEMRVDTVSID
jgi:hypothetical protein